MGCGEVKSSLPVWGREGRSSFMRKQRSRHVTLRPETSVSAVGQIHVKGVGSVGMQSGLSPGKNVCHVGNQTSRALAPL